MPTSFSSSATGVVVLPDYAAIYAWTRERLRTTSSSLPEQWMDEAAQALSFIACIGVLLAADNADFTLFALAGRRRAAERSGYVGLLINPVYDLVADEWRRLRGIGIVP